MARKSKKAKANMSKIRGLVYMTISILILLVIIGKYNDVVIKAEDEIKTLEAQKESVETQEAKLTEELALLDNEDYVTTYAREHYVFKSEDETVVKLSGSESEE